MHPPARKERHPACRTDGSVTGTAIACLPLAVSRQTVSASASAAGQGNVALVLQDGQPVNRECPPSGIRTAVRPCLSVHLPVPRFSGGAERAQQKKIRIAVCHDLSPSVSSPTAARTTVPSRRMPSRICPSEGVE